MARALVRPFALFVKEPIIQLLGLYMTYLYGLMYCEWFDSAISGISDLSQYF